jgi:4-aminobutyrate aminotransferase/(S)-3-amino-2-methylpropionate transaminase
VAVLQVIEEEHLLERGAAIGEVMRGRFESMQAGNPQIADVRGLGAMLGVEFVDDLGEPSPEIASRIVQEALERGLILLKAGVAGNVIRTLVPLVVTDEQLDEALDVFGAAVAAATTAVPA